MHPQNTIERIESWFYKIVLYILALLVVGMFVLLFMQVVYRYILHMPLYWVEELARFLMIYISTVGGTLAFMNDQHPRIQIFYSKFSPKKKLFYEVILRVLLFYFLWVFMKVGWSYAKGNSFMITSGLGISYFWPFFAIPLGGFSMFIMLCLDTIDICVYKRSYLKQMKADD